MALSMCLFFYVKNGIIYYGDKSVSINKPLFDKIYKKCSSIIDQSVDSNIIKKRKRLDDNYVALCKSADHEFQAFYSIVHELRLYDYVKKLGIGINAANDNKAGPDFVTDLGYIECVNATKGELGTPERLCLENRLKQSMNRYVSALPRLSSAILDKKRAYKGYLQKCQIDESKPRIIAISTSVFSNEFHSQLNLELILKILYGIGCRTMRFNLAANSFVEENGVESHAYEESAVRPPRNVDLPLSYFYNEEFKDISGVIVNNNAISEDLEKDYFCLLLNPFANVPIDKTRLPGIKYFELDNVDNNYATFRWYNE